MEQGCDAELFFLMEGKPFSQSCVENRDVILEVIKPRLNSCSDLLEIGSGTGQHACYFSQEMPHLKWHCSDRQENHAGIEMWLTEMQIGNILSPLDLDVTQKWPEIEYDAIFSANTCHIMEWSGVKALFAGVSVVLKPEGVMLIYGPFNRFGDYTSASNARFDAWLKERDPESGIRDLEAVEALATLNGLHLSERLDMPANNMILVFERVK